MANSFINSISTGVTTVTTVYTGIAATEATVIGMTIANTSAAAITASATLEGAFIVKNAPIPVGGSLVIVGGDQKLVVQSAQVLQVVATDTVDVITSILEIS